MIISEDDSYISTPWLLFSPWLPFLSELNCGEPCVHDVANLTTLVLQSDEQGADGGKNHTASAAISWIQFFVKSKY